MKKETPKGRIINAVAWATSMIVVAVIISGSVDKSTAGFVILMQIVCWLIADMSITRTTGDMTCKSPSRG
ncbi:hypothetical protein GCM10017044_18690 [Kordiimonas sediminis]|uniref:Uncharacterized protein n=1 Tax=Kordiimonas sediminis TaxID=1735581 RepID=A0A919E6L5_9PROT|nr:hypothetical protein [Kordiimonas sediminis]GHF24328.1 hypothetical protein GCM10017044_18690 [Kordiimonas sediminis]